MKNVYKLGAMVFALSVHISFIRNDFVMFILLFRGKDSLIIFQKVSGLLIHSFNFSRRYEFLVF